MKHILIMTFVMGIMPVLIGSLCFLHIHMYFFRKWAFAKNHLYFRSDEDQCDKNMDIFTYLNIDQFW